MNLLQSTKTKGEFAAIRPPLSYWQRWCKQLWNAAEPLWVARVGQDHFYRDHVVLPALTSAIIEKPLFCSLIDLGCGDGYSTEALLRLLIYYNKAPHSVMIADSSEQQLVIASSRALLQKARPQIIDLEGSDWSECLRDACSSRLVVSTFVLQELPDLRPFFRGLSEFLGPKDEALIVTLAPGYSQMLADQGLVRDLKRSQDPGMDWEWAGGYPVTVEPHTIYLPHFQRTIEAIQASCDECGIVLQSVKELSVPDTPDARLVFRSTVYGEAITKVSSSILLSLTGKNVEAAHDK